MQLPSPIRRRRGRSRAAIDSERNRPPTNPYQVRRAPKSSWSEASRGISGSIVGRESGGSISAVVDAPGFEARLSVATKGNRQSFVITSDGDIRNVNISMSRD